MGLSCSAACWNLPRAGIKPVSHREVLYGDFLIADVRNMTQTDFRVRVSFIRSWNQRAW